MSRSAAREVAMMMVYAGLMGGSETPKDIDAMLERVPPLEEEGRAFAEEIAEGVKERAEELDALIGEHSHEWAINRIGRVDLAILRVAVYEILYRDDVPTGAAINEAVELSKMYCGEKSSAFVNGILGGIVRDRQEEPAEDG